MSAPTSSSTSAPPDPAAVVPAGPPPPPPPAEEGLKWPANMPGLVCFFDPFSTKSRKTYDALMRHTKRTLATTSWVHEATHALVDTTLYPDGVPSLLRDAYAGKTTVSLDWARDSVFEDDVLDVNDEPYKVKWAQDAVPVRDEADKKGKKRERPTEEDHDDKPLLKKSASVSPDAPAASWQALSVRWSDEENMAFAKYMIDHPHPDWNAYHKKHPSRSAGAYSQRYGCAKDLIDKCMAKIRRERQKQQPSAPSGLTPSHRRHPSLQLGASEDDEMDDGDDTGEDVPGASNNGAPASRPGWSQRLGRPCTNCGATEAKSWHRLHQLNTPDDWYCGPCRGVFYPLCKTNLEGAKACLARRKERLEGLDPNQPLSIQVPRETPPFSAPAARTDRTDSHEPLSNGTGSNKRQSLPSGPIGTSSHASGSASRASLPGQASSSYLAPPATKPSSYNNTTSSRKADDFDPRLEKRRRQQEKMGVTPPRPRPPPPPPAATSSTSTQPAASQPQPQPWSRVPPSTTSASLFLEPGHPPKGCGPNTQYCHACGTTTTEKTWKLVRLRYADGEGTTGVKYLDRLLCSGCNEWWKARKEGKGERERVELTRGLEERGRAARRRRERGGD